MYYKIEELTAREFEVLAANYAKAIAPKYNWVITRSTIDFNRDFEYCLDNIDKWGEAKHTLKSSTTVSKSRWDPTLLSAILKNSVDELFLITCGTFPLEYIIRAEHLKNNNIKSIHYINRYLLDLWLDNDDLLFEQFNETRICLSDKMSRIRNEGKPHINVENKAIIKFFSLYDNDLLEPKTTLYRNTIYELNIITFCLSECNLQLQDAEGFTVVQIVSNNCVSPSLDGTNKNITDESQKLFHLNQGYNVIRLYCLFNAKCSDELTFVVTLDKESFKNNLKILSKPSESMESKEQEILKIERTINLNLTKKINTIEFVYTTLKDDLVRVSNSLLQNKYYFNFDKSEFENSVELCKLCILLLLNLNLQDVDTSTIFKVINSNINFCEFWLLDIAVGCVDPIFAQTSIERFFDSNNTFRNSLLEHKLSINNGCFIYLDHTENLTNTQYKFFETLKLNFISNNTSSLMIIKVNDTTNKNIEPQNSKNIIELLNKADVYYKKSEFFKALHFYKTIINAFGIDALDCKNLFRYAESTNHCDSMNVAKTLFHRVIEIAEPDNYEHKMIALEAQTEIFNLRFWQFETKNLVEDIDNFIVTYNNIFNIENQKRDNYSYLNAMNRKMVTLYLLGRYNDAETAFENCLNFLINDFKHQYLNYEAFAYLDSARGLYKFDIYEAQARLKKALKTLSKLPHELRRYLDCRLEKAFVDFVITSQNDSKISTDKLEREIANIKIHGYKNILIKCYLKLAACYLLQKNTDDAIKCLDFVKNNANFSENLRVKFLYNQLILSYHQILHYDFNKNAKMSDDYAKTTFTVAFNCFGNADILLETRIW